MAGYIGSRAVSVNTTSATITDDLTIGDDLTVTDDMTVGGTLGVTGVLTATSLDISGDIDVDGTTNLDVVDIDGAVDMASTLAVAGVVTANAGVVVDNFTLDGTTLALSSGSMILDAASNIILDADGGQIVIKDDGAQIANTLANNSGDLTLYLETADKSLKFGGNDAGNPITALTLDMSAAGAATFNAGITATSLLTTDFVDVRANDAEFYMTNAANNRYFRMKRNNSTADIDMSFFNGSAVQEKFSFESAGNFRITDGDVKIGTAGHGIDFSAQTQSSAQTNEELLNHYEQGTFTPTISAGGAGANAYSVQNGFFTRIGAMVHVHGYIQINGLGSMSGAVKMGGLPFAAVNVTNSYSSASIAYAAGLSITAGHSLGGITEPNATTIAIKIYDDAGGTTDLLPAELSADGQFIFTCSYHAV